MQIYKYMISTIQNFKKKGILVTSFKDVPNYPSYSWKDFLKNQYTAFQKGELSLFMFCLNITSYILLKFEIFTVHLFTRTFVGICVLQFLVVLALFNNPMRPFFVGLYLALIFMSVNLVFIFAIPPFRTYALTIVGTNYCSKHITN